MKNKLRGLFSNNKIRVFLFFLLISNVALLLNKLSKEHKTSLQFEIVAANIPANKILIKLPSTKITLYVKATGFNIIGYTLFNNKFTINAGIAQLVDGTTYKIETNKLFDEFQQQLSFGTEIIEITDKNIFIEMGKIISKKVPVKLKNSFTYEKGYKIKGAIKLTPDSMLVSGPENQIAKIVQIETNLLVLKNIYTDVNEKVFIKIPKEFKHIQISENSVNVAADIKKFTELSFVLPLKLINKPSGLTVKTFPSKVQLIFQVELSEIPKMNQESFEIVCDVRYAIQNNQTYFIPKLVKKPSSINNFYILPSKIDYIIQQ